jgi:hypothetical protein
MHVSHPRQNLMVLNCVIMYKTVDTHTLRSTQGSLLALSRRKVARMHALASSELSVCPRVSTRERVK